MSPKRCRVGGMIVTAIATIIVFLLWASWTKILSIAHYIYSLPSWMILGAVGVLFVIWIITTLSTVFGIGWIINDLTNNPSLRKTILALLKVGICSLLGYLAITCFLLLPDI